MKIPTTPPGNAPYYHGPPMNGIEPNPQWQGNGVMIEGNPPGNGAAYILPHPVHPAGYMPPHAGYYAPGASPPAQAAGPPAQQDFAEYMWMENEEEFDKQVLQQLEEEALMEQCIEAMLADEREASRRQMSLEEQVSKSTLNPLAAEFVPSFSPAPAAVPGTSTDRDPRPGASTLSSNAPKSIESSTSELSIGRTSDAPTESSKSSTAEEPSDLPADDAPEAEADDSNAAEDETAAVAETNEAGKIAESESAGKKADPESKDATKTPNGQRERIAIGAHKNSTKTQESKTETVGKKSETSAKIAPSKSQPHATKPKTEQKPTETGPRSSAENVAEQTAPSATTPEVEKTATFTGPPVFNYAAAARANLPPKQQTSQTAVSQPAAPPAVPPQQPAPKLENARKEPPSSIQNKTSTSTMPKPQTKPTVKPAKAPKDGKDVPKGPATARGANTGTSTKKNKK